MSTVQISQLGKIEKGKLRLGKLVRKPAGDGKFTSTFKMTRQSIPLGNGVELATDMPPGNNMVWLNVTAEAAQRLGWPHPANAKPKITAADMPRLQGIVASDNFGQQERLAALRQIYEVDPSLGQALSSAYGWLEAG